MLDRRAVESPGLAASSPRAGRERRRAFVGCAVLVLAFHVAFIGHIGGVVPGASDSGAAPMSVRTVPEQRAADALREPQPETAAKVPIEGGPLASVGVEPSTSIGADPVSGARPARKPAGPSAIASRPLALDREQASTDLEAPSAVVGRTATPAEAPLAAPPEAPAAVADRPASDAPDVGEAPAAAGTGARSARPPLLAPGEEPPPLYRTQLPPPVTLHYQVRRGSLRGTGLIRWQPSADGYRLVLEAYVGGVMLLTQASVGGLDGNGLAPTRFLDHRARRSAQAANFRRDDGRVTFSGIGVEWPLVPGSQDRLSWMIQLAGIAAAEPERLVDGGRIAMVVVGARGDAAVWTLRYAGRETIATVRGTVHAVKLVREGRSPYDTSADVWLDPERSYLPAQATLRSGAGALEYDLLLERVDPD